MCGNPEALPFEELQSGQTGAATQLEGYIAPNGSTICFGPHRSGWSENQQHLVDCMLLPLTVERTHVDEILVNVGKSKRSDDHPKPEVGIQIRFIVEPLNGPDDRNSDDETIDIGLQYDEDSEHVSPTETPSR